MNLKKLILSCTVVFASFSGFAQDEPLGELWLDCIYSSYADGGEAMKIALVDYEQQLIEMKVLSSSSTEAYKELLKKLQDTAYIASFSVPAFDDLGKQFQDVERDKDKMDACNEIMDKPEVNVLMDPVVDKMGEVYKSDPETVKITALAIEEVITEIQFDEQFFKIFIYIFLDRIQLEDRMYPDLSEIPPPPPPPPSTEFRISNLDKLMGLRMDLNNTFQIAITEDNEILIYGEIFTAEDLKDQYESYNSNTLPTEPTVMVLYEGYEQELVDRISNIIESTYYRIWNEMALEKHGAEYAQLLREQQLQITDEHPGILYIIDNTK